MEEVQLDTLDATSLTAQIVSAFVTNNSVPAAELAPLLTSVHAALAALATGGSAEPPVVEAEKATPQQIKKSITADALISFIDGKPYKTLKRHLATHGLDVDSYRARYGLPTNYPTVTANYSASRAAIAKTLGLGKRGRNAPQTVVAPIARP